MIKSVYIVIILSLLCLPSVGYSEFYKYKNESGVTIFTDDLSRVPEDQRSKVAPYEESQSYNDSKVYGEYNKDHMNNIEPEEVNLTDEFETNEENITQDAKNLVRLQEMNKKKEELETEYQALIKEKEDFENRKTEFESQEALNAYNEKIVNLNERISDYESRRQTFSGEVDAFNAQQDEK